MAATGRERATSSYAVQVSAVIALAFALSTVHTVYSYLAGISDPHFNLTTPAAWVFLATGFGGAALARSTARRSQLVLLGYLGVLLVVALFWYPTTFVPRQQTVFGWFENDVYTGLLMLAAYLSVLRLRGARGR